MPKSKGLDIWLGGPAEIIATERELLTSLVTHPTANARNRQKLTERSELSISVDAYPEVQGADGGARGLGDGVANECRHGGC